MIPHTKIQSLETEQDKYGFTLIARILNESEDSLMRSRSYATQGEADEAAYYIRFMRDMFIIENEWVCISSRNRSLEADVAQGAWRDGL